MDIFSRLNELAEDVRIQEEKVAEREKDAKELNSLRMKVNKLKKKRDVLRDRVMLLESNNGELKPLNLDEEVNNLAQICQFYELTGVSLKSLQDKTVQVCFNTSYKGEFSDTYYLDLEQHGSELRCGCHSLPSIIHLDEISGRQLNKDLRAFLNEISNLLMMFTARKKELLATQKNFERITVLGKCESLDFISLSFASVDYKDIQLPPIYIHLEYNSDSLLPKSVNIDIKADIQADDLVKEWTLIFKTLTLTEAIGAIVESLE